MSSSEGFPLADLPAEAGQRWVEIRDDRTTHRVRWEQVPEEAPDPQPVQDSPEQVARTRRLVSDLLRRPRC